tara:strand:- start:150 stop:455 length:306 start_codon:yes stop_codon:yes gene_type:complete
LAEEIEKERKSRRTQDDRRTRTVQRYCERTTVFCTSCNVRNFAVNIAYTRCRDSLLSNIVPFAIYKWRKEGEGGKLSQQVERERERERERKKRRRELVRLI